MAKPITMSHLDLNELSDYLNEILAEFTGASFEVRQKAVQKAAEVFKSAIEGKTPQDTGEMAQSWKIKEQYPDHRYVGNTRVATGVVHRKTKDGGKGEARTGVPLSNVLEYAENSPHNGFIRRCFDSMETQLFDIIKKIIENGGNQ